MQSSSVPLEHCADSASQLSPQRGPQSSSSDSILHNDNDQHTIQQQIIPPVSRDTPVATPKPATPPSVAQPSMHASPEPVARSPSSTTSSVSITSILSPTAPQFQTRLIDSPIDLHSISISSSEASSVRSPPDAHTEDVLDISNGAASLQEGLTPTQDTFPLKHTPTLASSASFPTSPSVSSESPTVTSNDSSFRTPNVYINGLPPNFPEDQLLAMTREFGEVLSVRTFTRHVSDKPSGYGFVLFDSADSAERCIETLRKYRNLHPSFSKQIHKIPGTPYATAGTSPQTPSDPPDSFKARMERLKDQGSTNLYLEGLPLSIDETTLAALMNPYRIMSSRFFQTRLSNPPRIIAFVRLESREAAEEIIERLHGRMVRGWRDAGSRISVRFADTSEQRELRRVERINREGGDSPARLTMAQAALLNLKGTQLQPGAEAPRLPSPNFGVSPTLRPEFHYSPELIGKPLPPPIGLHHQLRDPVLDPHDLSMTMGNMRIQQPYDGLNAQAAEYAGAGLRMPSHMLATDRAMSPEMLQMAMAMGAGPNPTRAQDGFTQMEQLILQSHARRQQQEVRALSMSGPRPDLARRPSRTSEFNMAAPEFSPSAATLSQLQGVSNVGARQGGARLMDYLPTMSEEDFHAAARGRQRTLPAEATVSPVIPQTKSERAARLTLDEASRNSFTRQRNQTHAEARAQAEQAMHTRSTTVPSHYPSTDRTSTLPQSPPFLNARSNDINASHSHSILNSSTANTLNGLGGLSISKNISYHSSTTASNNRISNNTLLRPRTTTKSMTTGNSNTSTQNNNNNASVTQAITARLLGTKNAQAPSAVAPRAGKIEPASHQQHPHAPTHAHARVNTTTALHSRQGTSVRAATVHDAEDEDDGSGLDSPALSYSARTPASLSPATPFSAFGETFDGPPMAVGNVKVASTGHEVGLGVAVGMAGVPQKTCATAVHTSAAVNN